MIVKNNYFTCLISLILTNIISVQICWLERLLSIILVDTVVACGMFLFEIQILNLLFSQSLRIFLKDLSCKPKNSAYLKFLYYLK